MVQVLHIYIYHILGHHRSIVHIVHIVRAAELYRAPCRVALATLAMSYSQRAKNAPTAKVTSKSSQAADLSGNPVSFTAQNGCCLFNVFMGNHGKPWVFTARIGYGTVMKHTGSLGLEET